jgi:hypothetical protein
MTAPHLMSTHDLLRAIREAIVNGDETEALRLIDDWLDFAREANAARRPR